MAPPVILNLDHLKRCPGEFGCVFFDMLIQQLLRQVLFVPASARPAAVAPAQKPGNSHWETNMFRTKVLSNVSADRIRRSGKPANRQGRFCQTRDSVKGIVNSVGN
jgi:hypothetical protein